MIELQNLKGYDEESIVDLLLDQKSQPFKIYIPKSTQKYFSDPNEIATDYAFLAYTGHLLSEFSDDFHYRFVPPEEHESVLFTISCKDLKVLAGALLFISYYSINDSPEDEEILFFDLIDDYLEKVETKEVIPVCPDFIEVYKEFSTGIDE